MVKNNEHEVYIARKMVQLLAEPLPLRAGGLILRAVQHQHKRVAGADRIVAAVLQVGKALEIIGERDFLIAVEIVLPRWGKPEFILRHTAVSLSHTFQSFLS